MHEDRRPTSRYSVPGYLLPHPKSSIHMWAGSLSQPGSHIIDTLAMVFFFLPAAVVFLLQDLVASCLRGPETLLPRAFIVLAMINGLSLAGGWRLDAGGWRLDQMITDLARRTVPKKKRENKVEIQKSKEERARESSTARRRAGIISTLDATKTRTKTCTAVVVPGKFDHL